MAFVCIIPHCHNAPVQAVQTQITQYHITDNQPVDSTKSPLLPTPDRRAARLPLDIHTIWRSTPDDYGSIIAGAVYQGSISTIKFRKYI